MRIRITSKPQLNQLGISIPIASVNSPLSYGLGSFGLESLYKVFIGFYMFYYIDQLGLAVAMAAIINVVYGIWDAANDPLVGFLSDNTRTRWGRRKPWLLVGLPFYLGTLVLVYAVPKPFTHGNALFWYAMVIFFLFEGAFTVVGVNYAALFPELFQGFMERARAGSYYQGLATLGELVGFAIPPFVYARFGFVPMATSFAILGGIPLFLAVIRNKEDPNASKTPPLHLKDAFGVVFKDRSFLMFTAAVTFLAFTTSVLTMATPFWVKYTISAKPQVTSLIFAVVFIVAILSVSIWGKLVGSVGIKRSWFWSVGVMVASTIILGFATNLLFGIIGAAVVGAGLGGVKVCREMIIANFVDSNVSRTGQHREGIYYSLVRVMSKFSKILESLALVILGLVFGYISGENPGPHPGDAFRFMMSVYPLVFTSIALLITIKLPFNNKQM